MSGVVIEALEMTVVDVREMSQQLPCRFGCWSLWSDEIIAMPFLQRCMIWSGSSLNSEKNDYTYVLY